MILEVSYTTSWHDTTADEVNPGRGARNPKTSQRSQSSVSTLPVPTRRVVNGRADRMVRLEALRGALPSLITFMTRKVEPLSHPLLVSARRIAATNSRSLV